jgi:hypothetical protein
MQARLKSAPVTIKAGDGDGIIEAMVATYDVDSGGDKIIPGAFAQTLDEWASSGQPIPFIWSHMHDDIDAYLGDVLEAREVAPTKDDDPGGLYIKAQIDMDDPKSAKAYRLMKSGRVRNYSFAYEVRDAAPSESDDSITELRQLGLFEVGPTLIGMNRETRTLSVKRGDVQRKQAEGDGAMLVAAYGWIGAVDSIVDEAIDELSQYLGLPSDDDEQDTPAAPAAAATSSRRDVRRKLGRVLNASNEQKLRDALSAISDVLAQIDAASSGDGADDEEGKSHTAEPVKVDEQRAAVKTDEPMQTGPDVDLDLSLQIARGMGETWTVSKSGASPN